MTLIPFSGPRCDTLTIMLSDFTLLSDLRSPLSSVSFRGESFDRNNGPKAELLPFSLNIEGVIQGRIGGSSVAWDFDASGRASSSSDWTGRHGITAVDGRVTGYMGDVEAGARSQGKVCPDGGNG